MSQVLGSANFFTWSVSRNVNDEESSLGIGLKGIYISSVSSK